MATWDELNKSAGGPAQKKPALGAKKSSWDTLNESAKSFVDTTQTRQEPISQPVQEEGLLSTIKKGVAQPFLQGGQTIAQGIEALGVLGSLAKRKFIDGEKISQEEKDIIQGKRSVSQMTADELSRVSPTVQEKYRSIEELQKGTEYGDLGVAKPYETPQQALLGGAAMATNVAPAGRAAAATKGILGGLVAPVVKESLKAAPIVGLGSGLTAASQGKSPEEIAKEAAIGAAATPVLGTALGVPLALLARGASKVAGKVLPRATQQVDSVVPPPFSPETPVIPKEGIEESVVQRINNVTGEMEYKVIPKGELDKFKALIDTGSKGEVGIAGKVIDGNQWHLTARSPEYMEGKGFKYGGVADEAEIPKVGVLSVENIKGKSQFTQGVMRDLTPEESVSLGKIKRISTGETKQDSISEIPGFMAQDGVNRPLIIDSGMLEKIQKIHGIKGGFMPENLAINANDWEYGIKNFDGNPDYITIVKEIPGTKGFFRIGAERRNGYFVVTHFEKQAKNDQALKNLLQRGEVLDKSGRAPVPSFATSPVGAASQPKLPGVKPKDIIPDITQNVNQGAQKPDIKKVSRVSERMALEHPGNVEVEAYTPVSLAKEAEKAVKLVETDPQQAYRVAMGATDAPAYEAVNTNIALTEQALSEGNNELAARLIRQRSLAQTERGQAIVSERASMTDNSTSRYVKELLSERLSNLGKRTDAIKESVLKQTKGSSAIKRIKDEASKARKSVSSKQLDLEAAQKLIDSLTCK